MVCAQSKCNKKLCFWMALAFYLEIAIAIAIAMYLQSTPLNYWLAFGHPLSRLPVFFMGICAGLLCVRIQNGDVDAINSKKTC